MSDLKIKDRLNGTPVNECKICHRDFNYLLVDHYCPDCRRTLENLPPQATVYK